MIASSNCETSRDFSDKFPWQCLIFCFNLEQTFLKCFNVKVEFCNNEANLCKPSSTSMGRDWEQAKHKSSWAFLLFSSSKTIKFVFLHSMPSRDLLLGSSGDWAKQRLSFFNRHFLKAVYMGKCQNLLHFILLKSNTFDRK